MAEPDSGEVARDLGQVRCPRFDAVLTREPPPALYHYTDLGGLLGILKSGVIWASQAQYLNDTQELLHAYSLFREEIERRRSCGQIDDQMRDLLLGAIDVSPWVMVFICSFSEHSDLLSQWRAYGDVAIDFGVPALQGLVARRPNALRLLPVVYGPEEQRNLVSELIDYCVAYQGATRWSGTGRPPAKPCGPFGQVAVRDAMALAAPCFKHEGYQEEGEWRLVVFQQGGEAEFPVHVRARGNLAVPFVKVPLNREETNPEIQHLFLGPSLASEANQRALLCAIEGSCFQMKGTIDLSETPYRP